MVHNGGITLNNSVHGEVAAVACIRDLPILETSDDSFDRINSGASSCQDKATSVACPVGNIKKLANPHQHNPERTGQEIEIRIKMSLPAGSGCRFRLRSMIMSLSTAKICDQLCDKTNKKVLDDVLVTHSKMTFGQMNPLIVNLGG